MDKMLCIAISGAGKAGTMLAKTLQRSELAVVRRIVSGSLESARRLAETVGAPAWGDSFDEIVADPEIDAVIIASPDRFHCDQTVAALDAGKHVLCEKPMCRSMDEADRMIAAAELNGRKLMIGFTERFNQPCLEAKSRIDHGEIGRVVMILARRCHPGRIVRGRSWLNDRETSGVLHYAGTHNIDLICWFMDAEPERVYAEMGRLVLPPEQEFTDSAVMTLKFPDGRLAALYESFGYPAASPHGVDRSIEILGERGSMKIDFMNQPLSVVSEEGVSLGDSVTWPRIGGELAGGALETEIRHFLRSILNDTPVMTPGSVGRTAIRWAESARRASQTGIPDSGSC